jgi:hypothetical protein
VGRLLGTSKSPAMAPTIRSSIAMVLGAGCTALTRRGGVVACADGGAARTRCSVHGRSEARSLTTRCRCRATAALRRLRSPPPAPPTVRRSSSDSRRRAAVLSSARRRSRAYGFVALTPRRVATHADAQMSGGRADLGSVSGLLESRTPPLAGRLEPRSARRSQES